MQKSFNTVKKSKADYLFGQKNIIIAFLQLAIPGFLIALMSGVYLFADQLLMAMLIPNDGVHGFSQIFPDFNYEQIKDWIEQFKQGTQTELSIFDTATIIKSALAITTPITLVVNTLPILVGIGASVVFTQVIARNDDKKAKEVYQTSFYTALILGLGTTLFFSLTNNFLLSATAGNSIDIKAIAAKKDFAPWWLDQLDAYFVKARSIQMQWSADYTLMIAIGSFFNIMIGFYTFMIRAEGRNGFVLWAVVACNFLNILLDFLLIQYARFGMMAAGTATLIGWFCNFFVFMLYVSYLSRKNMTHMKFVYLKLNRNFKFSWLLFLPIFFIGVTGLSRSLSNSIASMFFISTLNNVADSIDGKGGMYFQALSGAVIPINNLFFMAIFGVADGVRPLVAHCFSKNKMQRIKQAYWLCILFSLAYGMICYATLSSPAADGLLSLFNFSDPKMMKDAGHYLMFQSLVITFVSLSMGGLTLFQATNNLVQAFFASITQAVICFPIVLLCCSNASIATGNIWIAVALNPINTACSSIIILIWANTYMYLFLGKRQMKIKLRENDTLKNISMLISVKSPKLSFAQKQIEK